MNDNPWQVDSIQEFSYFVSYYKCPECSFDVREQQVFQEHAIENHPLSYVLFGKKDEEEKFHDPLKIEDLTSNTMVVKYEKLPNKKEIQFKNNLQETQSTENIEVNVSLSDKLTIDSETKIEKSDEENSPDQLQKLDMKKELDPPYSYKSKILEYLGIEYQKTEGLNGKELYQCSKCGKKLKGKRSIENHIQKIHGAKKPYQCSICDKGYLILYNLRIHIEQSHPKDQDQAWSKSHLDEVHEGKKPHSSLNCDTGFTVKEELDNHVKLVHEVKELDGSSAGKKSPNIKLKVHDGKKRAKKHLCTICDFKSSDIHNLRTHTECVHEGKKPYLCSFCGKSFGHPSTLQQHVILVHEKKKNHNCHLCNYTTGIRSHLNLHIAGVHEKKKTHKCSLCDYSALGSQNLKKHIESVHEKIRIPCNYCDATFTRKESLNIHIASVHEGKKPYNCSMCDLQFATKKRLTRHLEHVHEKKNRKICEMCSSSFSHIGNLKAHIASVHEGKKISKDKD